MQDAQLDAMTVEQLRAAVKTAEEERNDVMDRLDRIERALCASNKAEPEAEPRARAPGVHRSQYAWQYEALQQSPRAPRPAAVTAPRRSVAAHESAVAAAAPPPPMGAQQGAQQGAGLQELSEEDV